MGCMPWHMFSVRTAFERAMPISGSHQPSIAFQLPVPILGSRLPAVGAAVWFRCLWEGSGIVQLRCACHMQMLHTTVALQQLPVAVEASKTWSGVLRQVHVCLCRARSAQPAVLSLYCKQDELAVDTLKMRWGLHFIWGKTIDKLLNQRPLLASMEDLADSSADDPNSVQSHGQWRSWQIQEKSSTPTGAHVYVHGSRYGEYEGQLSGGEAYLNGHTVFASLDSGVPA
eukprot:1158455-Pelagomonas_calceolata.AAC.4